MTESHTIVVDGVMDAGASNSLLDPDTGRVPDRGRLERGNLFRWSLAVGLMTVLHGFWWFWLSPRPPVSSTASVQGPRLRFLPDDAGQHIWTPTVLALPTEIGFSGANMAPEFGEGPSMRMPRGRVTYMERDAYAVSSEDGEQMWTRPTLMVASPSPPSLTEDDPPVAPEPGVHVVFAGRPLATPGSLSDPSLPMDVNWSLSAWIELDDLGQIRHGMIESSSGRADVDRLVLRGLYRWRPDIALDETAGTITIHAVAAEAESP